MGATMMERGWEDREVTVNKTDLLGILQKNRETHIAEYREACAGYREAALTRIIELEGQLKASARRLKEGETVLVPVVQPGLAMPTSHEAAYDQIIRMMEMEVETTVKLRADEFACYVMDDWDWKQHFQSVTSNYMAGKAR